MFEEILLPQWLKNHGSTSMKADVSILDYLDNDA